MGIQAFKEQFDGKYDSMTPPTMLPVGALSDGLNVRKVSKTGGWKPRKGDTLHNTTAIAAASVLSLHYFKHPRLSDYHFLAQCNGNIYDSTNDPPTGGTTFGSSIFSGADSSIAGFSDVVGERFFYADPTAGLLTWGGDTPYCGGFVAYDSSETAYTDTTRQVTDGDSGTVGIILGASGDVAYVHSPEIAEAITLDLGTTNTDPSIMTLSSWVNGAWADRSATDGTKQASTAVDCTTYTETDAGSDITVTSTKVTVDTMVQTVDSGVYKSYGADYFGDFLHRAKINVTAASAVSSPSYVAIAYTDGDYTYADMDTNNLGIALCVSSSGDAGNYLLYLRDFTNDNNDITGNITINSARYVELERSGTAFTVKIYTDSGYSSLEDTLTIVCGADTYEYHVISGSRESAGAFTLSWTVEDILLDIGETLYQDGSITWTRNATDTMRVIDGKMGYWYKISFSHALSNTVTVNSCKLSYDMTTLTNKWDGVPAYISGCLFYDQSTGQYIECLGKVSNSSEAQYQSIDDATTSDYLYIKTPLLACGFGIGMVTGYENTGDAQVDNLEFWGGDGWQAVTTFTDQTLDDGADTSFSTTGWIWIDSAAKDYAANPAYRRTLAGDPIPGYWYRISWDAQLTTAADDMRVYQVTYAPWPETLADYKGCIQFKDRLLLWGDPEYPNRFRYSSKYFPDCFVGDDSGYTDSFGDMKEILTAKRFYNELAAGKEDSVWLLEGDGPENFGKLQISDTVGVASPHSFKVAETGFPAMHSDEPLSILLWQEVDGVYVLDGRKPRKVSPPVDRYFNAEYSECIAAASIRNRFAFTDRSNNEYHLLLPTSELVFNYITDEFYPPWERETDLVCGLSFKGTDNRWYTYGGDAAGRIHRLENDTTDKTAANADATISHSIKSRAISVTQAQSTSLRFTFRDVQLEAKAQSSGTVTTKTFKDQASSGTTQATPSALSLVSSGYSQVTPKLSISVPDCLSMQVEFSVATADVTAEIYSMFYLLEARGLGDG